MSAIENCIREAVEKGGYEPNVDLLWPLAENKVLLDPSFWQALGKAKGWLDWITEDHVYTTGESGQGRFTCPICVWHRFIDKLASGGTAEEFFRELQSGTDLA